MIAAYRVQPTASIVWLPLAIAVTLVFAVACAYVASLIGLWFRDLRPFVISFVRAMFFLAPGLVAIGDIGGSAESLVKLNPLTGLFEAYRSAFLEGHPARAWQFGYPLAWAAVFFAAALPLYVREEKQFAKVVE